MGKSPKNTCENQVEYMAKSRKIRGKITETHIGQSRKSTWMPKMKIDLWRYLSFSNLFLISFTSNIHFTGSSKIFPLNECGMIFLDLKQKETTHKLRCTHKHTHTHTQQQQQQQLQQPTTTTTNNNNQQQQQ